MKQDGWMPVRWKPRQAAKGIRGPKPGAIWKVAGTYDRPTDRQNATASHGEGL